MLRDLRNTYGFITKKAPNNNDSSFYRPAEYKQVYANELIMLQALIESNRDKLIIISKLGAGLANKYGIFEAVINTNIKGDLDKYPNVLFTW